jgi:hypothetical protein
MLAGVGRAGQTGGSNSTTLLGRPAHMQIDAAANELYIADGTNDQVLTVERESGRVLSAFGRPGRYAGQFLVLHNIAIDSKGNLYTSEVGSGKRAQKFRPAN